MPTIEQLQKRYDEHRKLYLAGNRRTPDYIGDHLLFLLNSAINAEKRPT